MAIHQTNKQSDLEKRLKLLRTQVYGRKDQTPTIHDLPVKNYSSDVAYLRQDLLKISLLSILAIGAQIILFYLSKNHVLNLNFF